MRDYAKAYEDMIRKVKTAKAKTEKAKKKAMHSNVSKYKGPASIPEGEIQQCVVKASVPPGASIWRNNLTAGWCGHCPPHRRISKTASTHGHRGSCLWVLRKLWKQYLRLQGLPREDCLISNLFSRSDAPGAGSSSSQ